MNPISHFSNFWNFSHNLLLSLLATQVLDMGLLIHHGFARHPINLRFSANAPSHQPKQMRASLICETCGQGFGNKRTLSYHLNKNAHSSTFAPTCQTCREAFPTESKLQQHICHNNAHSPPANIPASQHFLPTGPKLPVTPLSACIELPAIVSQLLPTTHAGPAILSTPSTNSALQCLSISTSTTSDRSVNLYPNGVQGKFVIRTAHLLASLFPMNKLFPYLMSTIPSIRVESARAILNDPLLRSHS
ncbi:hypothetical protein EJ08DRAFT_266111 [Tothia fuscella]|uniref:C2H2-type domain-containing protein n=1 Tax=Tothia fuscella TaxID=1048955 RepID=A0A9P4TXY1_9PEZI|nr:hypothetical protein EJ08DRAFT_266111 [Tothia fuscella]